MVFASRFQETILSSRNTIGNFVAKPQLHQIRYSAFHFSTKSTTSWGQEWSSILSPRGVSL
jgi:hypothetical protein